MKLKAYFNGHEITEYCDIVMGLDYPFTLARSDETISPGDMVGSELLSSRDGSGTITMPIKIEGNVSAKRNALTRLLWVHEPGKLVISDEPDRYWLAMPKADIRMPRDTNALVKATIEWILYYPYSFANDEKLFTSASQKSAQSFNIDFKNKVVNSLSQNANKIYTKLNNGEVNKPDDFTSEFTQPSYAKISSQDGVAGRSGNIMIQYDIAKQMEILSPGFWIKYGLSDKTDKRKWLEDNLSSLKINTWSFGDSSTAHIQLWNGTEWTGTQTNTAKSATLNSYSIAGAELSNYMTETGYIYVLLWGDSGNVVLDYTNVDLTVGLPTQEDSITVINDGDVPVPVDFDFTNYGQNGFIGVEGSNNEAILIGKPNEIDGGVVSKSERLFTTIQDNANGLKQWTTNSGVLNDWNEDPHQIGKFDLPYEERWRVRNTLQGIATNWGPHTANGRGWHGPSLYSEFAKDSEGSVGAANFTSRAYVWFGSGNMQSSGLTQVNISGENGKFIAGVQIWKGINQHGSIKVRVGDNWAYIDENNPRWDDFFGSIVISRHGNQYQIEVQDVEAGKGTRQVIPYTDPVSAVVKATGFTYWKAGWGDWDDISYQDFYDFWFQKDNVENYVDVPNTFVNGDSINIDGSDGKVRTSVNGTLKLGLQDIASTPILAYPGTNIYRFSYSTFASRPDVTARLREQFIAGGERS